MAKRKAITTERPPNPAMIAFGQAYYDPASTTFQNAAKSAIVAGYSAKSAKQIGCDLAKHPVILARFSGLQSSNPAVAKVEREITRGYIIEELETGKRLALAAKDTGAYLRAVELQGKTGGIFIDVVGFDPQQLKQLTEAQEREARRISSLILDNTIAGTGNESAMLQSQPDIIPASNNSAMLQSIGPAVDPAGVVPSLETDATAQAMAHAALDGIDGVQPGPGAAGIDTSLTTVSTESDQGTKGTMQTSAPDTTGTDSRGTPANPPTGAASNNDIPHPDASDFGACLGDLEISTLPCLPVSEAVPQSPAGGSENSTDVPVRAKRVKSEFEEWYDEAHKKWKRRRVYPAESVVLNGGDIPSGDQRDGTAGEVRGERVCVGDSVGDGGECGGNGG